MGQTVLAKKLFKAVDERGMHVIRTDELNAGDFVSFGYLMREVSSAVDDNDELRKVVASICACMYADERFYR